MPAADAIITSVTRGSPWLSRVSTNAPSMADLLVVPCDYVVRIPECRLVRWSSLGE